MIRRTQHPVVKPETSVLYTLVSGFWHRTFVFIPDKLILCQVVGTQALLAFQLSQLQDR